MRFVVYCIIFCIFHSVVSAQSASITDRLFRSCAWLVMPDGYYQGYLLRDYIRDSSYLNDTEGMVDRAKVDAIYFYAYNICSANATAALLATSLAVLEHRHISIALPVLKTIPLPLTFESEARFTLRHERLPSELYLKGKDDRDKLQHFFISAYLKRIMKMNWLVRLLGTVLEAAEEVFVVDGEYDIRDIHANNDGIAFGAALCDTLILPGAFFTK